MIMFSLPFKMILRQIAREYMRRQFPEYVKKYPRIACYSSDYISLKILLDGLHEARELDFLGSKIFPRLDRRRTCVDVGANIGNHALYFSRFFEKVFALEPDRRAYRLLRFNSESADNIVPLNLGCSNVKRTARAVESQVNLGATTITDGASKQERGSDEVIFLLEKLDDVVKDSVDFIKIDIEGHERECLEGAVRTLRKHQPLVILEVSRKTMENGKSAAVEFLKENGYRFIYTMRKTRGSFRLVPTEKFARKNYRMVLCSPRPVDWR